DLSVAFGSCLQLVTLSECAGAERLSASRRVPRMCPLRGRFREFYPGTIPNAAIHRQCSTTGEFKGEASGGNSLKQHRGRHILGMFRLVLSRGAPSDFAQHDKEGMD